MRVKKAVVAITGASRGIGRAAALEFADKAARLVLAARSAGTLESLAHEVRKRGGKAVAVPTDVTDADSVEALAARAVKEFGRLDVWVNNAAVGVYGRVADIPLADISTGSSAPVSGSGHGGAYQCGIHRWRGIPALRRGVLHVQGCGGCLSVSIRSELRLDRIRKVKVCTVLPAAIDTPFSSTLPTTPGGRLWPCRRSTPRNAWQEPSLAWQPDRGGKPWLVLPAVCWCSSTR